MGNSASDNYTTPRRDWSLVAAEHGLELYKESDGLIFHGKCWLLLAPHAGAIVDDHREDNYKEGTHFVIGRDYELSDGRTYLERLRPFLPLQTLSGPQLQKLLKELQSHPSCPPLALLVRARYVLALERALQRSSDHAESPLRLTATDGDGNTAIHVAADSPPTDQLAAQCLDLLLRFPALIRARNRRGQTALHRASHVGNVAAIRRLVGAGAQVDEADSTGATPLHLAVMEDQESALDTLLSLHADIAAVQRESGCTALHLAARHQAFDCLSAIIHKRLQDPSARTAKGETALHYAAISDWPKAVHMLLEQKVDPAAATTDERLTALHYAAMHGSVHVGSLLLRVAPQLISQGDAKGRTPLHIAIHLQKADFVELACTINDQVIGHINVHQRDDRGRTLLQLADSDHRMMRHVLSVQVRHLLRENAMLRESLIGPSALDPASASAAGTFHTSPPSTGSAATPLPRPPPAHASAAAPASAPTAASAAAEAAASGPQPPPVGGHAAAMRTRLLEEERVAMQNRIADLTAQVAELEAKHAATFVKSDSDEAARKELHRYKEMLTCSICLGQTCDIGFDPCGHVCACRACAAQLQKCPLCRTPIHSRLKLFGLVPAA